MGKFDLRIDFDSYQNGQRNHCGVCLLRGEEGGWSRRVALAIGSTCQAHLGKAMPPNAPPVERSSPRATRHVYPANCTPQRASKRTLPSASPHQSAFRKANPHPFMSIPPGPFRHPSHPQARPRRVTGRGEGKGRPSLMFA